MEEQNQYKQEPEIINNVNTGTNTNNVNMEEAPTILKVVSFLIPLVGLILFCVNINEKPKYAKGCGIPALIGFFVVPIVVMILFLILFFAIGFGVYNQAQTAIEDFDIPTDTSVTSGTVDRFNDTFEYYEGTSSYSSVRNLMTLVSNNNLIEDQLITVTFDGEEMTPSEVRAEVVGGDMYKIKFGYDIYGYIDEVIITTIN